jgi:hypothetical protein
VLAQRDVDQKTNEITQVRPLLDNVDITGALVTADAMHVQKDTARYIVEDKDADYLFTAVKDNQPGLFAALDALRPCTMSATPPWTRTPSDSAPGHRPRSRLLSATQPRPARRRSASRILTCRGPVLPPSR